MSTRHKGISGALSDVTRVVIDLAKITSMSPRSTTGRRRRTQTPPAPGSSHTLRCCRAAAPKRSRLAGARTARGGWRLTRRHGTPPENGAPP